MGDASLARLARVSFSCDPNNVEDMRGRGF